MDSFSCVNCGYTLGYPKAANERLDRCTELENCVEIVLECPYCGQLTVEGGEPDIDTLELLQSGVKRNTVMIYSRDYFEPQDKNLPRYVAVKQEETKGD